MDPHLLARLSSNERAVLALRDLGLNPAEIGQRLLMSEHTVDAFLDSAQRKLRGTQRRLRMEEEMDAPAGYFQMWARTFFIDAPVKRAEGGELTDEEARPIHAAITQILDEAEVEIRRKLEAIVPTYPTHPTFKLRAR